MKRVAFLIFLLCVSSSAMATGYERFESNGKVGIKDEEGHIIVPADFDELGWSDGNFSVIGKITGYRKKTLWGVLNLNKEFITPAEFEILTWPGGDRLVAGKSAGMLSIKYGCLDLAGRIIVPFYYDDLELHGLRAVVMQKKGTRYEYGLIDVDNKTILPVAYQKITPIGSLRYAVQDFTNKIALCGEGGNWITPFIIDGISDFIHDHAVIREGWKKGLINRNGEVQIEPVYRDIEITSPVAAAVKKAVAWKIFDPQYRQLQTLEADSVAFESNGWSRMGIANKFGFVDDKFQQQWPPVYDFVGPIENKMVIVKKNGKWGLLKIDQTPVLPFTFDSLCVSRNIVRAYQKIAGKPVWTVYDTVGVKKTEKNYDYIANYNGRFFPAKKNGYWGIIDRYGKEKVACVYDSLLASKDELMTVKFKGQYGIITLDDQWKMPPQDFPLTLLDDSHFIQKQDSIFFLKDFAGNSIYFTTNPITVFGGRIIERLPDGTEKEINLYGQLVSRSERQILPPRTEQVFRESEGLTGIRRDGKFGFVDERGRLRVANRYDGIGEFHNGLAPIRLLGKWGFIDKSDQIIIQPTFDTTGDFDQNVALVSRNGKYGIIGTDGNILLELRYDSIRRLAGQQFVIWQQSLTGLADVNGRVLIEPRFDSIEPVGSGLAIVRRANLYGVLTIDGLSVFPIQFSRIDYIASKNFFLVKEVTPWETVPLRSQ
jgi:hypothetical protein